MELYPTSKFYGAAAILKRYMRCPKALPLPATIQHGWYYDAAVQGLLDLQGTQVWCWSSRVASTFRGLDPAKAVHPIGAAFLYQLKMMQWNDASKQMRRSGTIVFPSHSSQTIRVDCDYEKYAEMLDELDDEFKPITVCVYYTDLNTGYADIFRRRGFEIVCNGENRLEPRFLKNLIEHAAHKRYALSNQMTSGLLFASMLGSISYIYGPEFEVHNEGNRAWAELDQTAYHRNWIADNSQYFSFQQADPQLQKGFVESELGVEHIKSPKELRKLCFQACASTGYAHALRRCLFVK